MSESKVSTLQIWFSKREYKLLTEMAQENCFSNPTQMWRVKLKLAIKENSKGKLKRGYESLGDDFLADDTRNSKLQIKFDSKDWEVLERIALARGYKCVTKMWKSIMLYQITKFEDAKKGN